MTVADVIIEALDGATAPEDHLRAWYALELVEHEEAWSENSASPWEEFLDGIRRTQSYATTLRWIAWDPTRTTAVGYGALGLQYTETNRDLTWPFVYVHPEHRRQGLGSRLLGLALDAAVADGRTSLGAGVIGESDGEAYVASLGFVRKIVERKSRLLTADVDRALMQEWIERATERAGAYELFGFDGICPADLVEEYVEFSHVMNTAPRDDFEMEDWKETPERFLENEEKAVAEGQWAWRLLARHKESGELAGYTELFFSKHHDDVCWQGGTGVQPHHRNAGLGRLLKATNILRLLDEKPGIEKVDTWNARSNDPMLGINIAMGFQVVKWTASYQAKTADIQAALAARA